MFSGHMNYSEPKIQLRGLTKVSGTKNAPINLVRLARLFEITKKFLIRIFFDRSEIFDH